ncbi:MAG TPA: ComEC/Rec2 family competence protein [Pelagibacterium sp.]|uniref:ComEC/Rec2 family competence protein n=1 Tax=Pelagibacterium sp. TaxID=1967288 RepID=UPI002CE039CE|nr:ComEC/Rec2 family competence protein [Pelagibacterium sp.]HWJ87320.1 ComEC/Rec2 family competence protein [Pelagibacterium sp.]
MGQTVTKFGIFADWRNQFADAVSDAVTQRRNFVLWPFVMILGLATYRSLPVEPQPVTLVMALLAFLILEIARPNSNGFAQMGMIFCLGIMLLPIHGALLGTAMLDAPRYGTYTARVDSIPFNDGQQQRWILSDIEGDEAWTVPPVRRARIVVQGDYPVVPGDRIEARIRFYPVPAPAVPGGHDSQFASYFSGIGAYGNAFDEVIVTPGTSKTLQRIVEHARNAITARLVNQLGDRIGGIAAALISGDQSRISDEDYDVMAQAGIVHVISISGLHLTLVAGTMLLCVRFVLALGHGVTQRWPIKKIAAVFGIVTAIGYMMLSGMVIPAVRSTIMLGLVFAAIIAGRQALTMRNVAIAALIIIAVEPASVFRPSFQLSFAAVVALIAAYELVRRRREARQGPARGRVWRMSIDVAMTSLIAGLATLVFTAYHFQQTAPFGVLGNLMVMPAVSFVMMPAALFGTLLLPFGLEGPVYMALGWSVEFMLWCATFVRDLAGGFDPSPILAPSALLVTLAALAWLAYFRDGIRLLGPLLAVPVIAVCCLEPVPDILIADQSQALAVRHGGELALIAGRLNTFATNVWSERYITDIGKSHENNHCDSMGCVIDSDKGFTLALVKTRAAFDEDCRVADIVVTRLVAPSACREVARMVVDASDLERLGAHMIGWNEKALTVRTAIDPPDRPWRIGSVSR